MICKINLKYNFFKNCSPELYERLRKIITELPHEISDDMRNGYWQSHEADISALAEMGIPFEVEERVSLSATNAIIRRLEELKNKIEDYRYEKNQQFNEKVSVHVPDNALLRIREVFVADDCCTITLNDYLKEGWQIIAVCPQPDQRRPDYILGHRGADR